MKLLCFIQEQNYVDFSILLCIDVHHSDMVLSDWVIAYLLCFIQSGQRIVSSIQESGNS